MKPCSHVSYARTKKYITRKHQVGLQENVGDCFAYRTQTWGIEGFAFAWSQLPCAWFPAQGPDAVFSSSSTQNGRHTMGCASFVLLRCSTHQNNRGDQKIYRRHLGSWPCRRQKAGNHQHSDSLDECHVEGEPTHTTSAAGVVLFWHMEIPTHWMRTCIPMRLLLAEILWLCPNSKNKLHCSNIYILFENILSREQMSVKK